MPLDVYQPLQPREIRLLRVQSDSNLDFKFVHADIDQAQYGALSYTWGDAVFPCAITINGQRKRITQNLFDALSTLVPKSRSWMSHTPELWWIDAICINQDNVNERSTQVRLMKTLYENAVKIYVWLGKPQDEALIALATNQMKAFDARFVQVMKKGRPYRPWWWPLKDQPPDDMSNLLTSISSTDKTVFDQPGTPIHSSWLGIFTLLDAAWWGRTWIQQEATVPEDFVAKFVRGGPVRRSVSKITFHCGQSTVTWTHFSVTMRILRHLESIPNHPVLTMTRNSHASYHAIEFLRSARLQNLDFAFLEALRIFRPSSCKDLRDKIYAPLLLASESARQTIVPDYGKGLLQICTEVARYQLQQSGHEFDFLGHMAPIEGRPPLPIRQSSNTSRQWPSWLPDWSMPVVVYPLVKLIHVQKAAGGRSIRPYDNNSAIDRTQHKTKAYGASANLAAAVIIDDMRLRVHAVICDVVHETTDFAGLNDKVSRWRHDARDIYWTGEPWSKALHHTCAADIQWTTANLPCARNGIADPEFINRPVHSVRADDLSCQRLMRTAFDQARWHRKLCLTQNKSVGLVPVTTEPGDKVYMFYGSQVLHVLRSRIDLTEEVAYTYIGEAYVHGLMDGQVVEALNKGGVEDTLVTIL